jgi:hypothetical protein
MQCPVATFLSRFWFVLIAVVLKSYAFTDAHNDPVKIWAIALNYQ